MRQHQLPTNHPPRARIDHGRAHRAHMRNVKFSQKRGTWTRLSRVVAAWNARTTRGEKFSGHEQRMFDAAKVELQLVEDQLDQMTAEAEAEIVVEEEEELEARGEARNTDDVDPFARQKIREAELRAKAKLST